MARCGQCVAIERELLLCHREREEGAQKRQPRAPTVAREVLAKDLRIGDRVEDREVAPCAHSAASPCCLA